MLIKVTNCYQYGKLSRSPGQVIDVFADEYMYAVGGGHAVKAEQKPVVEKENKKVTTKKKRKTKRKAK